MRRLSSSAFHLGHLELSKIQDGNLFGSRIGLTLRVVMTGRWSLPVLGPCVVTELKVKRDEVMIRSMVDSLPEAETTLLPMFMGVRIAASG